MRVSPNADAQASNSWTPRSKRASGDWKRSSGDRRSRGLGERPARVLLVDEASFDVEVPGALRALRIDALQVDAVGGEGELAELLGLVDDDLVDADFLDRDHVVAAVIDAFEPFGKPFFDRFDALARRAVPVVA